ncbi:unnamed protein product [Amoebophrya sp. A120]|nr:unnamed protein product [Amoebophrya sp. A120]|eukprot:GSA120T00010450001.1
MATTTPTRPPRPHALFRASCHPGADGGMPCFGSGYVELEHEKILVLHRGRRDRRGVLDLNVRGFFDATGSTTAASGALSSTTQELHQQTSKPKHRRQWIDRLKQTVESVLLQTLESPESEQVSGSIMLDIVVLQQGSGTSGFYTSKGSTTKISGSSGPSCSATSSTDCSPGEALVARTANPNPLSLTASAATMAACLALADAGVKLRGLVGMSACALAVRFSSRCSDAEEGLDVAEASGNATSSACSTQQLEKDMLTTTPKASTSGSGAAENRSNKHMTRTSSSGGSILYAEVAGSVAFLEHQQSKNVLAVNTSSEKRISTLPNLLDLARADVHEYQCLMREALKEAVVAKMMNVG